jgi:pimeloyl-ACP methyl ester carboxylesterase
VAVNQPPNPLRRAAHNLPSRRPARYEVLPIPATIAPVFEALQPKGTCLLLHGWDSKGSDMLPLSDALQQLPTAAGWSFCCATYETHLKTFVEAALDLAPQAQMLTPPLLIVGYSEGAIVARQMIANGLNVKALVTICAPHQGLLPWIPTPDLGSGSVSPFSVDLANLNASNQDAQNRLKYYLFAISSDDWFGHHDDDGVVAVSSALGMSLGPVAERAQPIELNYAGMIAGWAPHEQGMNPAYLEPVLATCEQLLA